MTSKLSLTQAQRDLTNAYEELEMRWKSRQSEFDDFERKLEDLQRLKDANYADLAATEKKLDKVKYELELQKEKTDNIY